MASAGCVTGPAAVPGRRAIDAEAVFVVGSELHAHHERLAVSPARPAHGLRIHRPPAADREPTPAHVLVEDEPYLAQLGIDVQVAISGDGLDDLRGHRPDGDRG